MKTIQSKFLCVAALAFLAISGCKTAGISETSGNSAVNSGSVSGAKETTASADPKTALISSMKNMQDAKSWIADVEMSGETMPQGNMKMQVKYAAPDSFQIETNMAENKMQIVSVGGKTYMQMGGKWQQAPSSVNMGEMINRWKEMFDSKKMDAFKNIQSAGKETVDGKELAVYTYEIDQQAAMPEEMKKEMSDEVKAKLAEMKSESTAKVWIDEAKNLPAKMDMTMKMSAPKETTQKFSVKYTFDQPVNIEAPSLK